MKWFGVKCVGLRFQKKKKSISTAGERLHKKFRDKAQIEQQGGDSNYQKKSGT